ncbi:MAG: hypothetical protein HUJ60_05050, partial [Bacilli bacterium]|nr:hypothetical protein [Bacilli bacterium]
TIKISSYVAHISEDGETVVAMATASSSCYAMSRTINTYSSSAYKLKKAAYGATALCEICPSSSTYGTMNGDLFMLENGQIVFGYAENLTGDEIWLDGCEFDLTLGGVSRGNMVNVGGTSSTAGKIIPNVMGTYTTGGDDLVVTGTGVTYGALTNKPYELDDQTMVLTFFNDVLGEDDVTTRTIYAATVDPVTHTATIATSEKYYKDQPVDTVWNEGTYPWTESPAGTWTAPSGHHSTIVTIKVTCATAGVLSFDWTVSSESGYDYLNVQYDANGDGSTDGYAPGYSASTTDKNAHSGTGKSGKFTKDVVAGEVIWINYEKDSTTSKGLDNVVISNISLWGEVTL